MSPGARPMGAFHDALTSNALQQRTKQVPSNTLQNHKAGITKICGPYPVITLNKNQTVT